MSKYKNTGIDEYITVKDMIGILSISKTKAYEIATSGDLETLKIGRCLRISASSLREWIAFHSEE